MHRVSSPDGEQSIHVRLTDTLSASSYQRVRVAGRHVALDYALAEFDVFRAVEPLTPIAAHHEANEVPAAPQWESAGTGTIGSWDVAFTARYDPRFGHDIDIAGGPRVRIAPEGREIRLAHPCPISLDDPLVAQTVLGPALLLALALHGTFALHASAAAHSGRAAVFLGESGAGKSTLAADLGRRAGHGWSRLSDDVLPIAMTADGVLEALPEYPQLKLAPEEQYVALGPRPERIAIGAIYALDAIFGGDAAEPVTITALSPRDAFVALIEQTVASRLFAPDLSALHLDFCAAIATTVPMKRLCYPRRLDAFDAVAEALDADLEA